MKFCLFSYVAKAEAKYNTRAIFPNSDGWKEITSPIIIQFFAPYNSVPNSNANRAIGILSQMRFDPYQQVQQVRDAYRQGLYNIN